MNEFWQSISQLPWTSLSPMIGAFLLGLALWLGGRRILRTTFAVTGLAAGSIFGWLFASSVNLGVPAWIGAAAGGIILAIVALTAYRMAVAACLALVLGIVSPLGVSVAVEHGWLDSARIAPVADIVQDHVDGTDTLINTLDTVDPGLAGELAEESVNTLSGSLALDDETLAKVQQLSQVVRELVERGFQSWQQAPGDVQLALIISALVGALMGVGLGLLAPTFSAAIVTSMIATFMILGGGWMIAARLGVAAESWMPASATSWSIWWAIISVIGLSIQWTFFSTKADKPG